MLSNSVEIYGPEDCRFSLDISSSNCGLVTNSLSAILGWELDESGIGTCYMIWASAEFLKTSFRQALTAYCTHVVGTPKKFNMKFL
jgi:hypothetical protein